jgi:riboflavin synthase
MFTGIIESVGLVRSMQKMDRSARLEVMAELADNDLKIGDSVAVNGVCLTVTERLNNTFKADAGLETLKVTTLGDLKAGDNVNIERPMQMGGRLGGHLVQGHIDCTGKILFINKIGGEVEVTVEFPREFSKYVVKRGSVAINGVSLTTAGIEGDSFKVFLIPHTVEATTFKFAHAGDAVNIEVDIVGKYIERMACIGAEGDHARSNITEEFLRQNGFV